MKEYYDLRAPYYDDWWVGAARVRPGWQEELTDALATVASLPPARTLDVACGTGFLTQQLEGDVVGLDQSARMLTEARRRLPERTFVQGDALALPFPDARSAASSRATSTATSSRKTAFSFSTRRDASPKGSW